MLEGEGTQSRKKSRFMHYELRVTVSARERAFVDAFEGRVGEQGSEEDPFILNAHL